MMAGKHQAPTMTRVLLYIKIQAERKVCDYQMTSSHTWQRLQKARYGSLEVEAKRLDRGCFFPFGAPVERRRK